MNCSYISIISSIDINPLFPAIYPHRTKLVAVCLCGQKVGYTGFHYSDVIMSTIASQITSLTIVYSIVYSDADQRKHQSSASLAFVWGIHRGPVNSPHKWPVTRKMFPFDHVIMSPCPSVCPFVDGMVFEVTIQFAFQIQIRISYALSYGMLLIFVIKSQILYFDDFCTSAILS